MKSRKDKIIEELKNMGYDFSDFEEEKDIFKQDKYTYNNYVTVSYQTYDVDGNTPLHNMVSVFTGYDPRANFSFTEMRLIIELGEILRKEKEYSPNMWVPGGGEVT